MNMNDISLESVKKSIKKRPEDIHKGNCGRLLIFAGAGGINEEIGRASCRERV